MYFAGNAVFTSIVSAISGSLIYEAIKNLFISKAAGGIVWATSEIIDGVVVQAIDVAAGKFGVASNQVFNLGTLLVPFIVSICCILGALLARRMPRDYTPELVGKELKELNPEIDLSLIEKDPSYHVKEEKGEILFVQIGLSIISGFIFGFIWTAYLFKSVKEFIGGFKNKLAWALSAFVPFASIFFLLKAHKGLKTEANTQGVKLIGNEIIFVILGVLFPILPINIVALALMQKNINKLYEKENTQTETVTA